MSFMRGGLTKISRAFARWRLKAAFVMSLSLAVAGAVFRPAMARETLYGRVVVPRAAVRHHST